MTKIKSHIYILVVVFICFLWSACQRIADPCLLPTIVGVSIGTYKPADTGRLGVDSVLPKAVLGYVDNGAWQYAGAKASKFNMRLSSLKDTCKWFITPDSTTVNLDTISVIYSRQLNFISTTCGYAYHYFISDIKWTTNSIDSVIINNVNIEGAANVENVKVFY